MGQSRGFSGPSATVGRRLLLQTTVDDKIVHLGDVERAHQLLLIWWCTSVRSQALVSSRSDAPSDAPLSEAWLFSGPEHKPRSGHLVSSGL